MQSFSPDELEFKVHGAGGTISVPYESVARLRTRRFFRIYFDESVVKGRLLGIDGEDLLIGESVETAERVPLA